MNLPNGKRAYIPNRKLTNYLLSPTHPIGRWKAKFFHSLGFDSAEKELLEKALLSIAQKGKIEYTIETEFGVKYIVDGHIRGLDGTTRLIRTIWIIETGQETPYFVTAYPLE